MEVLTPRQVTFVLASLWCAPRKEYRNPELHAWRSLNCNLRNVFTSPHPVSANESRPTGLP